MDIFERRRTDPNQLQPDARTQVAAPLSGNLRRPRHAGIFQAVHALDTQLDEAQRAELARWVRDAYQADYGDVPLGFVAPCYLGPPYVDHRLDLSQSIVEHYTPADPMPEPFTRARMLARTRAYAFVEVYASGDVLPVRDDGGVVS